jgi:hypothetical protein
MATKLKEKLQKMLLFSARLNTKLCTTKEFGLENP